ncbi:Hypothetical predicted protein [Olea europaea subsp. europaea]|uniref:Uncharacterized protein n=1 Tax=Olea europaea subsp. europaea TaxID=158383 RepID=A0A8S0SNM7_OLEEU|nr:Hypothetical predicted protein [Olea europaea subsp. europaea]
MKLQIIYEDIDGPSTGPNASRFISEIGSRVQIFAPLQKIFEKDMIEYEKSPIYDKVEKEMIDMQTTQEAHIEGEENESQGVQLTVNEIVTRVLGTTSCNYRDLERGPKVSRAISRANTTQRDNTKLRQVVHNLQSQNEPILISLEEIMPSANARIGSPRVPTTHPSP